jgi:hypothetical protein
MPAMPIKHTKETHLWPVTIPLFPFGFEYIEYYADPVLVVLPDYPLVCVRSVCLDDATLLVRGLRHLMVFQLESPRVQRHGVLTE